MGALVAPRAQIEIFLWHLGTLHQSRRRRCWALPLDGCLYGLVDDVAQCPGELSATVAVARGNDVLVGQTVATIEAMKMGRRRSRRPRRAPCNASQCRRQHRSRAAICSWVLW